MQAIFHRKWILVSALITSFTAQAALDEQPKLPDWAQLHFYAADNAKLKKVPSTGRVVFYGDSLFNAWPKLDAEFRANPHFIGRGIDGQTTAHMLTRWRSDVLALKPDVMVLLAGTNDLAQNEGAGSPEQILANISSMVELAKVHGIKPIIVSLLPAFDYPWRKGLQPAAKIVAINQGLRQLCKETAVPYVDLHTSMRDARNGMQAQYSSDGVHPNALAYQFMREKINPVIAKLTR
ncbi:MAG: hypothetical protein K2P84_12340 [Undibacterium sp.]|nr:hypothetical protein [Undibacterium sp.]